MLDQLYHRGQSIPNRLLELFRPFYHPKARLNI